MEIEKLGGDTMKDTKSVMRHAVLYFQRSLYVNQLCPICGSTEYPLV